MLKIDPINLLSLVIALAAYVGAIRLAVIGRMGATPAPAEALKMEGAAGDGPSPFQAGTVTNEYQGGTTIGGKDPFSCTWMIFTSCCSVLGLLEGLGRFMVRPCTPAVVIKMKMTSSTYARSSMGVMLMVS